MQTMKTLVLSLGLVTLPITAANADRPGEPHGGGHAEPPRAARNYPARPEPPKYQAHPVGTHPHGPIVRAHTVRVMGPKVVHYGKAEWKHWEHAEFARPAYYWDWAVVHHVTCVAEDSYGDQYPVSEATWNGFALGNMSSIEDDALDRCYAESGGDPSCFLATCSHF